MHEEKHLSTKYYLGTVPNHGLKFLLEDRKTLGQLTLNLFFQFRKKARIQHLKRCFACSHPFVLAAFQALSFNQPGENRQCTVALVLVVGISSSIAGFLHQAGEIIKIII